jgi:YHS domain-containing protein
LAVEGIFSLLGGIPGSRPEQIVETSFRWNYTTFLNIAFLGGFAVLFWLHRNRERLGGGQGYAIDPICGMQVETANAPAVAHHDGRALYFCSDRCRERFVADPGRYATRAGRTHGAAGDDHGHDHLAPPADSGGHHVAVQLGRRPAPEATATATAIDPICGMTVDPATAAASLERDGTTWYFCCQGCADRFAAAG